VVAWSHRRRAGLTLSDSLEEAGTTEPPDPSEAAPSGPRNGGGRKALAALIAIGGVALAAVAGHHVREHFDRPFDPRTTPIGAVLGRGLPAFLVQAHQSGGHVPATQRAALFPASTKPAFGEAAGAIDAVFTTIDDAARIEPTTADARQEAFLAALTTANVALEKGKKPYFLDGDLFGASDRRLPVVFSFYVQREGTFPVGEPSLPERVVWVWRLDGLNLRKPYLGYTRPAMGAAIVSLDEVESQLVQYVLPALAPGEPVELLDEVSLDGSLAWQKTLQDRAGEAVRAEVGRGADAATGEVGQLLARRRKLIRSWRTDLAALGHRLVIPERLIPEADYVHDLAGRLGRGELADWEDVHDDLHAEPRLRAFERVRDGFALAVQRHELQHRLDFRLELVPLPPSLRELLGVRNELALSPTSLPLRVRDEHAAYLASLASTSYPHTDTVLLSRFLFDKSQWGDVYSYTALAVLSDLATHLDVVPSEPLVERRAIVRERVARLLERLLSFDDGALRDAARRAFVAARGGDGPVALPATLPSTQSAAAWRH
jgi:hypothetical protein